MNKYDVAIIGAGSAGLVACKVANGLGKKTVLIEKEHIGGDCTWFGCIPSKTLVQAARAAHESRRLDRYGIKTPNPRELDCSAVMDHVRNIRAKDAAEHSPHSIEKEGIDFIEGSPEFLDAHKIKVGDRTITAKKFILCTGSHPFVPPIEGLADVDYLTNETLFEIESLPTSLLILGGGPIGSEMAMALNRLGVQVTLVEKGDCVLSKDDEELTCRLAEIMKDEGVRLLKNAKLTKVEKTESGIRGTVRHANEDIEVDAERVFVSVGRRASLEGLALEKAGVEYDDKGVKVDSRLRTTAGNIFACGDIVPPFQFTHIAEYEAVIAAANASLPFAVKKADYEHIVWTTFTTPEVAHAGMAEQQARDKYGDKVKIYRWDWKDVDRAKTDLNTQGLTKVVCDKRGKILGVHILGHNAAEAMHECQYAKCIGRKFSSIAKIVHAYPSYSDAVRQPAKKAHIEQLRNNPAVKVAQTLASRKVRNRLLLLLAAAVILISLRFAVGDKLSLENIQANADRLVEVANRHYAMSVLVYIGVYIIVAAFSLPGAAVLTIAAGFVYTALPAAIYTNAGATGGAFLAFLFARYIAGNLLQKRFAKKLARFNKELETHGAHYLLTLRFIPIFPFFLINLCAGLTKVKVWTFIWTTSLGIFPGSLIYAFAGQTFGTIESVRDIFSWQVLAMFTLLALLAIVPVLYRKFISPRRESNKTKAANT
ncbi:Mercuric reductase [Anaerohalosphaera lusitana]|uniref:Mercuric reductase n=1 Tax=Anaerohalosphaera lusitana TaxID=1936003 RepID=A0A1U9NMU3_9BACT|nr:FAD-dependent oxidoreductase [Anaerohalosphaera lusitana]AQT69241.1 Mercuric reductase [Anaerohalosphaera lusitana]